MQPSWPVLVVGALILVAIVGGRTPIARKLSRRVIVEASPERFVFSSRGISFELATFMYVTRGDNRVVAIGKEPSDESEADALRIDLFKGGSSARPAADKFDALRSFFDYGIRRMCKGVFIIRPTIVVKGVEAFDDLLCGYHEGLFRAAIASVVYDVVFE